MLKKRLIFTLLFDSHDGYFMLSRNFRLQRAGDLNWLLKNYNFKAVTRFIDELVLLDVTRNQPCLDNFLGALNTLAGLCFIPITCGGRVHSLDQVQTYLRCGCDKVLINSQVFSDFDFVKNLSAYLGAQSVVASLDFLRTELGALTVYTNQGSLRVDSDLTDLLSKLEPYVGELYLNAIHSDGTGSGLDLDAAKFFSSITSLPFILSGGAGRASHIVSALQLDDVQAVSTANLFNFIGDGLSRTRLEISDSGILLPNFI